MRAKARVARTVIESEYTSTNRCGVEESNLRRSLMADNTHSHMLSLAWIRISTRLRRNAIPHQTLPKILKNRVIEFFIITSGKVDITAKTERKMSNANEIATCISTCVCNSKPV